MKNALRKKLLKKRRALTNEEITQKSQSICKKLEPFLFTDKCTAVMVYIPNDNEVDIYSLIRRLLAEEKKVVVPYCLEVGHMVPSQVNDLEEDLVPGRYGILVPKEHRHLPEEEIDAIIVPGVGFDKMGNRLGMGAGYYDRFLPRMRGNAKKIAVCFDLQITDEFSAESWDFPVDMVITESEIY